VRRQQRGLHRSSSLSNSTINVIDDTSDITTVSNTCHISLVGNQRNGTSFISTFSSSQHLCVHSVSAAVTSASAAATSARQRHKQQRSIQH
jgi:hypothetical protein